MEEGRLAVLQSFPPAQGMTVRIRRHPDCAPGTWWWKAEHAGPLVSCPSCQALHTVAPPDFHVAIDGSVSPPVTCTSCRWTGLLRLEGWDGKPCR